jgi:hypothetical protein
MNRKKITIIAPLKATLVDQLSVRTFHTGETVWWDTEQTCDPVEFEVHNFRFSVFERNFSEARGFQRRQQLSRSNLLLTHKVFTPCHFPADTGLITLF